MRHLLCGAAIVALVPWSLPSRVMAAAPPKQQAIVSQKSEVVTAAGYVGSEACTTCHADLSSKFSTNPHAKLALTHGGQGATCESCHGPGQAHVESGGDATKIFRFSKASSKLVDERCMSCHAGAHPNFLHSPHGQAGVGCTSCHSTHAFQSESHMLKVDQPGLCYGCHTGVKAAFAQPFHHKVDEGVMKCSDCHDSHGTFQGKQLKTTADHNAVCTKCHTDTAGPFVFEHPVVKTEGCSVCHSPHGSVNPRMINVANVNTLCLQCHANVNNTGFPNAVSETGGPVHNQATRFVACTNCHTQIHGSNAAFNLFR